MNSLITRFIFSLVDINPSKLAKKFDAQDSELQSEIADLKREVDALVQSTDEFLKKYKEDLKNAGK